MAESSYVTALTQAIVTLDFEGVKKAAQEAMDAGIEPTTAITQGMVPGMIEVGRRFETGEYFLSELVVSGEVMKDGIEVVNPYIKGEGPATKGKMLIATVAGDMHDIGKNIVTTLARVQGIDVLDLGVDVPTEEIVDAVAGRQPDILGLSALLTSTMPRMAEVIEALESTGIRDRLKVIVGGAPLTVEFAEGIGADHKAANALEGVHKCLEWVGAS